MPARIRSANPPTRGGSEPKVKSTVEETGGFQNWKTRTVGTFEAKEDLDLELEVIPQTNPGAAVMDLQQIVLHPVGETRTSKQQQ